MGDRGRIIGPGNRRQGLRERDRFAGLHQLRGGGALFVGDKVQGAALVILAPAAPVTDLLEDTENLLSLKRFAIGFLR